MEIIIPFLFALFADVINTSWASQGMSACDERREESLSINGAKFHCTGSECRAKVSPAVALRWAEGLASGGIHGCRDISARPDAKSSSGAITDPCCNAGGSSCTHVYYYVVSESAAVICLTL